MKVTVQYGAVDEELATLFCFCWEKTLSHLPPSERLPATMAYIRRVLDRDYQAAQRETIRYSKPKGGRKREIWLMTTGATTIRPLIERFATAYGFETDDLIGANTSREVTRARHEAMWAMHRVFELSKSRVAFCFGGRDHTTAIWAIRRIDKLIATEPALEQRIRQIATGDGAATTLIVVPSKAAA